MNNHDNFSVANVYVKKYEILIETKRVQCNAFATKKQPANQVNVVTVLPLCTIDVIRHAELIKRNMTLLSWILHWTVSVLLWLTDSFLDAI